jgi:hypothetical protein
MTTCVFCGRAIEPGEEVAGRAPMAAHASCADAALADDRHWDAIADRSPEEAESPAPPTPESPTSRRAGGCLVLVLAGLAAGLGAVAGHASRER